MLPNLLNKVGSFLNFKKLAIKENFNIPGNDIVKLGSITFLRLLKKIERFFSIQNCIEICELNLKELLRSKVIILGGLFL